MTMWRSITDMSRQEDECNAKEKINNFSLIQSYIHADNNFAVRLRRFLFRHMYETSFRNPGYSKPFHLQKQPVSNRAGSTQPDYRSRLQLWGNLP